MPDTAVFKKLEEELEKKFAEYQEIQPEPDGEEDEEEETHEESTPATATEPVKPNGNETFVAPAADPAKKPDKAEFAFAQLRKERDEAKKALEEKAKREGEFEALAKSYGFTNTEEFLAAQKKARIEKEAKDKGVDPAVHAELVQLREDVAALRGKDVETKNEQKKEAFRIAIDTAVKSWGLSEAERDDMFERMAKDGYTVDHLLTLPKPEVFVNAYVPEAKVAAKYGKASKKDFVEKKVESAGAMSDEEARARLVDKEMADYAERSGKKYVRRFKD